MTQTAPIIQSIEKSVKDVPGWTPIDQLYSLFVLAVSTTGLKGDILELGSWCGRSAIALGLAARLMKETKVMCVDLFPEKSDWYENKDGSYSFKVTIGDKLFDAYHEQTVWKEPFERDIVPVYQRNESLLETFRQCVANQSLDDIVTPFRGDLALFSKEGPQDFKCKLAFIDGDHSYEAVCGDIARVEKYLVPGGWICFDDAFSSYEGVNKAISDKIIANPRYSFAQQFTRKFFAARFSG
ncbi:class I SAM-dependent methyltransferase [Polaromonas sp. YR568]|uniref:class I SAM-dependent methyltransferase n=1 Tax=Polaromonas sp. YR568 TaxID=1855301 RepID=UPI00398C0064